MFLKALILSQAISCPAQPGLTPADTVILNEKDFRVLRNDTVSMEIEVGDSVRFRNLQRSSSGVILVCYRSERLIAKGNHMLKSSVPENCDMFYLMFDNGMAFFKGKQICFIKIRPRRAETEKFSNQLAY